MRPNGPRGRLVGIDQGFSIKGETSHKLRIFVFLESGRNINDSVITKVNPFSVSSG